MMMTEDEDENDDDDDLKVDRLVKSDFSASTLLHV